MAVCDRQNIHNSWRWCQCVYLCVCVCQRERECGGWHWENCRLFVQARQCCVCLLLVSLSSWLPLRCHRTGIMWTAWKLRENQRQFLLLCAPPNSCASELCVLMPLCTFTAASCPCDSSVCSAGRSSGAVLLLRGLVAFLALIETAETLEKGGYIHVYPS